MDTLRCIDLQPLGLHGNLGMGVGGGFGFYFSLQWHGTMVMVKFSSQTYLPCDIGGAKEPGMMYFPTK